MTAHPSLNNTQEATSLLNRIRTGASDVRMDPGEDTWVAISSLIAFWGIYFLNATVESTGVLLLFLVGGNLLITVLLPVYYLCGLRNEPLSQVGLTIKGWVGASVASTVLALVLLPGLLDTAAGVSAAVLIPHVITNGLMLWEHFFVHGWLQMRFERAFGPVPGMLLAGASFAGFHIGTRAPEELLFLFLFGSLHALLFRIFNRNLLVIWPALWAVGAAMGTLENGLLFGWTEVLVYATILLITAGSISWIAKK